MVPVCGKAATHTKVKASIKDHFFIIGQWYSGVRKFVFGPGTLTCSVLPGSGF
jgi:hypothetical protein